MLSLLLRFTDSDCPFGVFKLVLLSNYLKLLFELIQSCRSCYARLCLCQHPFYKIIVKVRNSKQNVLKMVLIIVNINKDENKSLISYQFSLQNDSPLPHFLENYSAEVKIKNCGYHVYTIVAIMFTPLWLSCLHHLVYLFPGIFCTFKYFFIILY